jgi:hypothetical protein
MMPKQTTRRDELVTDDRPQVEIDVNEVSRTVDGLWEAYASTMDEACPHTVARLGRLCRFGEDDATGRTVLREHDVDTLRDEMTEHVRPIRLVRERVCGMRAGTKVHPEHTEECFGYAVQGTRLVNEVAHALLKRSLDRLDRVRKVPRVDRVVDVPVFGPDGELLLGTGHHPEARVFYDGEPVEPFTNGWDDVEVRFADVEWARHLLLDDLLGDFPFADDASRAHALGMLVEQFARGMIDGPTPAYVVIAAEQGTGKSLLTQACLLPSCGRVDLSPEPDPSPQDFQKRLLSELIRGPQAIVFDNVTRRLEDSALSAMLTSGRYADRVLGRSEVLSFPVRHTTVFTMNNPEIGPDIRRRSAPIYLDAGVERPWERVGPAGQDRWTHPNLLAWADQKRPTLVRAALVLVEHYAQGWDDDEAGRWRERPNRLMGGSFDEWSKVVGGIVSAAGVPGFGGNLDRLYEEQSDEDSDEAAFLAAWPESRRLTAAEVVRFVTVGLDGGIPTVPPQCLRDRRSGRVDSQSVGNGLRNLRGRVRGGRRVVREGRDWFVEAATGS